MCNTNLLTGYSFLASLNETGTDMYNAVYVPMCMRNGIVCVYIYIIFCLARLGI